MKQLVKLWKRPSYDGARFTYYLLYTDEQLKRRQKSLGHIDARKAERQRAQLERELRMGIVEPGSMKLSEFLEDSMTRTGQQIRESTCYEVEYAMNHFIEVIGDLDYQHIQLKHGELFLQSCLDKGNSPATAAKKLRHLKRLFQLAVNRKQLEENPLQHIEFPKSPKKKVEIYNADECERILNAARHSQTETSVKWELLILLALLTGMRRGEILNTTWTDIDFDAMTIEVSPKKSTETTWEWHIKDTDRRSLPLTEGLILMLADHQSKQPNGYPYVFVPNSRYDYIQQLRRQGEWGFCDARLKLINNFNRDFRKILRAAGIEKGQFHTLRKTALSNWLANAMSEHEVMLLAGHASFATTHEFYLAVADDLMDRARRVASHTMNKICCKSVADGVQVVSRVDRDCRKLLYSNDLRLKRP